MLSGRRNILWLTGKTFSDLVTPSIHECIMKVAAITWTLYQHAVCIWRAFVQNFIFIFLIIPLFSHTLVNISNIAAAGQISCNEYCPVCLSSLPLEYTLFFSANSLVTQNSLSKKNLQMEFTKLTWTLNSLSFGWTKCFSKINLKCLDSPFTTGFPWNSKFIFQCI